MLLHDWNCYGLFTKEKSIALNIGEYIAHWLFKIERKNFFFKLRGCNHLLCSLQSRQGVREEKKLCLVKKVEKSSNQHFTMLPYTFWISMRTTRKLLTHSQEFFYNEILWCLILWAITTSKYFFISMAILY